MNVDGDSRQSTRQSDIVIYGSVLGVGWVVQQVVYRLPLEVWHLLATLALIGGVDPLAKRIRKQGWN